jgi:two-component system chemotaxis response regulator CheY
MDQSGNQNSEQNATILVVDDSSYLRIKMKKILEKYGYNVVGEAADGVEAIGKFKDLNPDIITMDIVMPKQDGIETLKKIKRINPNARVIMVSSVGLQDKVLDSLKAGASNFVVKPFKESKIIKAIERFLS